MPEEADRFSSIVSSTANATATFGMQIWTVDIPAVERAPPDNPIYSYVGQIASGWAHVEHTFDLIIWELAKIDPENGACITAQMMSVYSRCRAIVALLTLYGKKTSRNTESLATKAIELSNRANGPGEKRNRAVHDPWYVYTGSDKTGQFRAMPPKDLRFGVAPVDKAELEATLIEIKKFSERVIAFRHDIQKMLATP